MVTFPKEETVFKYDDVAFICRLYQQHFCGSGVSAALHHDAVVCFTSKNLHPLVI